MYNGLWVQFITNKERNKQQPEIKIIIKVTISISSSNDTSSASLKNKNKKCTDVIPILTSELSMSQLDKSVPSYPYLSSVKQEV